MDTNIEIIPRKDDHLNRIDSPNVVHHVERPEQDRGEEKAQRRVYEYAVRVNILPAGEQRAHANAKGESVADGQRPQGKRDGLSRLGCGMVYESGGVEETKKHQHSWDTHSHLREGAPERRPEGVVRVPGKNPDESQVPHNTVHPREANDDLAQIWKAFDPLIADGVHKCDD